MKSLFGALLILSFCCFVLGCFECMPEVIGPIDVDDDNGGHVVVVNLPNGKRWTSAVEKIPKEIADYSFSAVVDVLVEFNCETVVKDASGKRIGRSPATEGIGFFVNYSQGRYMSKFVMSSSHALKPWHLPNFKDRYPDLNEANCKVHKASFETNGNNVDFEEYHFVENSTPGFGNGDDIVVFVPPLEHVMEVPGFNVEKSWENEEACYLVTLSKRENDFETQKPAFVVDVLENTEDLEAEYETIEREYNETFVGKGFVIVAEGTCKYGSNGLGEHNIPAVGGFSGSPIIVKRSGVYKVIGMHNGYVGGVKGRNVLGRFDSEAVEGAFRMTFNSEAVEGV